MNVSSIQAPQKGPLPRSQSKAVDKEAEFLSLRLLNKRIRIRLSPDYLDLNSFDGKGNLFTIANSKGWFAAVTRKGGSDSQIILSPLADLRSALLSATAEEGEVPFEPKRILFMAPSTPMYLTFGFNDDKLIVGLAQGPVLIYDTMKLLSAGSEEIAPLHSFPPASSGSLQQILPNPGDLPELVAVRRDMDVNSVGQPIEVLDLKQMQSVGGWRNGTTPDAIPTSMTWSPKGKQLAIGLQSGDILTFSPTAASTPKLHLSKPSEVGDYSIISTMWLSNPAFYAIFAPPRSLDPEADQKHYITLYDSKSNSATDVQFTPPTFPSPALRPPGSFSVILRNWSPAKFLLFIGDSPSSDIGLVGCTGDANTGEETWCNLSLEETSMPSLPLDKDSNDTVLLGLELDLTNTQSVQSGDERPDFPPPPIMYAYASDGTLQAWYVINSEGGAYPGMAGASVGVPAPTTPVPSFATPASQTPEQRQTPPTTSPFGSPAFGTSGFGQQPSVSPFAQASGSAFGKQPAFGQSSFGGTSSMAQSTTPATSPFSQGSTAPSFGGFGSFAKQSPSQFGSTGFGFGGTTSSPMALAPSTSMGSDTDAAPPAEMSEADSGFGGLSLGGSSESEPKPPGEGVFGSFGRPATSSATSQPSSGFGTTGFGGPSSSTNSFKPAPGFGAFANIGQNPMSSSSASSNSEPIQKASGFGTSSFGSTQSQSSFGQSGFGQSGFGQPSFGASSFGKTSFGSTPNAATSSAFGNPKGGFGAFAQGGATGFASFAGTNQTSFNTNQASAASDGETKSVFGSSKPPSASTGAFGGTANVFGARAIPITTSTQPLPQSTRAKTPTSSPDVSPKSSHTNMLLTTSESPSTVSKPLPTFGSPSPPAAFGQVMNVTSASLPSSAPVKNNMPASEVRALGKPNSEAATSPSPWPSPSSAASSFKSSAPASGFGAFGQLKSSPSAFKPAEGFGAFGGAAVAGSSSPFLNPKPVEVSAFGVKSVFGPDGSGSAASSTSTTRNAGSPTPTFGSTSMFGTKASQPVFGQSPFASPSPSSSPVPAKAPAIPSAGAFSAFGGTSGGFNAFAAAGKSSSFSDLLRSKSDQEAAKPVSVFGSLAPAKEPAPAKEVQSGDANQEVQTKKAPGPSPSLSAASSSKSSTPTTGFGASDQQDPSPPTFKPAEGFAPAAAVSGSSSPLLSQPVSIKKDKDKVPDDETSSADLSNSLSLSSLSESFVDVSSNRDDDNTVTPEGSEDDGDGDLGDEEEEEGEEEEDGSSFISASVSDGSQRDTGDEEEDGSLPPSPPPEDSTTALEPTDAPLPATPQVVVKSEPDPVSIPLPQSTASSIPPTPKQEPSTIKTELPKVTISEVLTSKKSSPTSPAQSPEPPLFLPAVSEALLKEPDQNVPKSTTPPGSPGKEEEPVLTPSVLSPKPVLPSALAPVPQSSSLGLGRPTSRPTRSSPLAGAPVSREGGEGEESPDTSSAQTAQTAVKPRPASPKLPFGVLPTMTTKTESAEVSKPVAKAPEVSRSKTPPLLFTAAPTKPPVLGAFSLAPASAPPPLPVFSSGPPATQAPSLSPSTPPIAPVGPAFSFDKPASHPQPSPPLFSVAPSAAPPSISRPASIPPSAFPSGTSAVRAQSSSPAPSVFAFPPATPARPSSSPTTAATTPAVAFPASPSGTPDGRTPAPAATMFPPKPASLPPANLFGSQAPITSTPKLPVPQQTFESGMQLEFQELYLGLNRELENLQRLSQEAAALGMRLNKPSGAKHTKADLGNPSKWSFSELELFGKTLKTLEADILHLYNTNETCVQPMRELESDLLKAETRKEEIMRFSRAKADPEFAKMLKVRTLGPEHVETQTQLRKQVRAMNDRVEQLEDHLQACKKKLNEHRTGKPSFKPPSLDTINRTYRNIDIAIEQQSEQITALSTRVSKLDLNSTSLRTHAERDKRLPDDTVSRPFNVTPSVAASTAAALNAERSAQRLKTALARIQTQPLLNTQATKLAVSPPTLGGSLAGPSAPSTPLQLDRSSLFGTDTQSRSPEWSYGPETPSYESRRERLPSRTSAHAKAVPLKRSPGATAPAPTASFDWGPLPGVAPSSSLSPDVRPAGGRKSKN